MVVSFQLFLRLLGFLLGSVSTKFVDSVTHVVDADVVGLMLLLLVLFVVVVLVMVCIMSRLLLRRLREIVEEPGTYLLSQSQCRFHLSQQLRQHQLHSP